LNLMFHMSASCFGGLYSEIAEGLGLTSSAPQDQRAASTYIVGAICPAAGATAGLALPR